MRTNLITWLLSSLKEEIVMKTFCIDLLFSLFSYIAKNEKSSNKHCDQGQELNAYIWWLSDIRFSNLEPINIKFTYKGNCCICSLCNCFSWSWGSNYGFSSYWSNGSCWFRSCSRSINSIYFVIKSFCVNNLCWRLSACYFCDICAQVIYLNDSVWSWGISLIIHLSGNSCCWDRFWNNIRLSN